MIPGLQIDGGTIGAKFRDSLLKIVASTHSSREIFDRFVEVLGRMTQLDRCDLSHFLSDSTTATLTAKILHVHCSYPTQFLKAGRVVSLSDEQSQAIRMGQAIRISDLLEKPASVSPDLLAEGIRSYLAMPIQFRGEALGLLMFGSRAVGVFEDADVALAQVAAQILGMVMHQDFGDRASRLEEESTASETLLEASGLLFDREDPPSTFERLAAVLRERLRGSCCEILLWDEQSSHLVLEASTCAGPAISPVTIPAGKGIAGIAAAERTPLCVPHTDRDPRYIARHPHTRAQMAVPILGATSDGTGHRLLGVINLESAEPETFSDRDLALAVSVSRQIALWMENRLLRAEREKAEKAASTAAAELSLKLQELRENQAQLVQAEKMAAVGTLVAGAAHELNNPLTVMQGYSELMLSQNLSTPIRDRVQMIHEHARMAGQIVEGLLQMSRVVLETASPLPQGPLLDKSEPIAPKQERRAACDVAEAVTESIAACAAMLNQGNITVKVETDPYLFACIDPGEMRKILGNIIVNSEYALRESLRKEIVIETRRVGDRAELRVADSGPGIESDVLPQVFDPFFTTKPVGHGTGLGLSVCYGIVSSHDGTIEAANLPDGGAEFTVSLPALPDVQNPAVCAGKILVVAADEVARSLWQETLAEENCEVIAVASCADAFSHLTRTSAIDLVIADLRAPHLEGLQFHADIGRRGLLVPLVLVTGEALSPAARQALSQTGCPLLSKPFKLSELRRVLGEALLR